jgi:hypothetical protein
MADSAKSRRACGPYFACLANARSWGASKSVRRAIGMVNILTSP